MVIQVDPVDFNDHLERPDKPRRIVFFGTPTFAVPTLERLAADPRFVVSLVVTQPDRPAGRGNKVEPAPVKVAAVRLGIQIYQPSTLRDPASRQPLVDVGADLFVVAAYGLIFGPRTLAIPRIGCVNVHASLLPRYRGASPIAAAILAGDALTGVSLMVMEAGLDTGAVIAQAETVVAPADTTASLTARLGEIGANLVAARLTEFSAGVLPAQSQPVEGASLTRPLVKADGWLDWNRPAAVLERQIRAMWSWPRAWTTSGDEGLQIHEAVVIEAAMDEPPGTLLEVAGDPVVVCGSEALGLQIVQPAGGRPMPGAAFLAGRRYLVRHRLGSGGTPVTPGPIVNPLPFVDGTTGR